MPVTCYICGRDFGTASIVIHIPQCEKKWDVQQQKLPAKQRRPPPTKPFEFDQIIKGDLKGPELQKLMDDYNKQAFDDFNKKALDPCKNCGRTFLPSSLEIHLRSCKPKSPTSLNPGPGQRRTKSPVKGLGLAARQSMSTSTQSIPTNHNNNSALARRPGTYKKSNTMTTGPTDGWMNKEEPTREDLIAMVERDVAFSSIENRIKLMDFIKNISQSF